MVEWIGSIVLSKSVLALVGAFFGGILASFTPCVYPLLPVTISFMGSQAGNSRKKVLALSLFYVMGFSFSYTFLGIVAGFAGKAFGFWAGNKWLYLVVGNVCLLNSFVMLEFVNFGGVSLYLSTKRFGKLDIISSFGMGMASSLVLGPCTTPILGTLLSIVAVQGDILFGGLMLISFSIGLAFWIILFGVFANMVIPKAGPWLRRIQQFFGLLMLAVAQYFFVKAGMVWD